MKTCAACSEEKSLDDFHKDKGRVDGLYPYCKLCQNEKVRWACMKSRYGIEQEEYNSLLESQGGVCAICRQEDPSGVNLAVDHCHTSGEIRGLLCGRCNRALGLLLENSTLLQRATEYVRKHEDPEDAEEGR